MSKVSFCAPAASAALLAACLLALPAAAQDAARGAALYDFCSECHGDDGLGNRAIGAPAIGGMSQWYVENQLHGFREGLRGTHFDDLNGMKMRPMSLTLGGDEDITNVAAHVASLPAVSPEPTLSGGDPERGKALYAPCIACHGPQAKGNEPLNGPALVHQSDWYLMSSLERYQQGIRGWNPDDQSGKLMQTMARTLADDQAIKDVIAYVRTLEEE